MSPTDAMLSPVSLILRNRRQLRLRGEPGAAHGRDAEKSAAAAASARAASGSFDTQSVCGSARGIDMPGMRVDLPASHALRCSVPTGAGGEELEEDMTASSLHFSGPASAALPAVHASTFSAPEPADIQHRPVSLAATPASASVPASAIVVPVLDVENAPAEILSPKGRKAAPLAAPLRTADSMKPRILSPRPKNILRRVIN